MNELTPNFYCGTEDANLLKFEFVHPQKVQINRYRPCFKVESVEIKDLQEKSSD
jgi:hypothetical protein